MKPSSFKDYIHYIDDETSTKTRTRMNKKSHKGRYYGGLGLQPASTDMSVDGVGDAGGMAGGEGEEELVNKDQETEIDNETPSEDPNKQGMLRHVKNAHLVYKRRTEQGTFQELWIYNTGSKIQDETVIKKDILAGTDIPPNKTKSLDGAQSYEIVTLGNAQLLLIKNLVQ